MIAGFFAALCYTPMTDHVPIPDQTAAPVATGATENGPEEGIRARTEGRARDAHAMTEDGGSADPPYGLQERVSQGPPWRTICV